MENKVKPDAAAKEEAKVEAQESSEHLLSLLLVVFTIAAIWGGLDSDLRLEKSRKPIESSAKNKRLRAEIEEILVFKKVPKGVFQMGSKEGFLWKDRLPTPVHTVSVEAFLMSETEVTVAQYKKCFDAGICTEPTAQYPEYCSWGKPGKENHPVNCVDWGQARTFAVWVNAELPTEAQWEYAARGGESFKFAGSNDADKVAWYVDNYITHTHTVKTKQANGYDLYDMNGNVWEWTLDEWHPNYEGAPNNAETVWGELRACTPKCEPIFGTDRIVRGGGYFDSELVFQVAHRNRKQSYTQEDSIGFRICRALPQSAN